MSAGPLPRQDAVIRYGEERATEFARITKAQEVLTSAFDSLAFAIDNHAAMAESSWAFDYLWGLLNARRVETLAEEKR